MATFDWSELMRILAEQKKLNEEIQGRLGKIEARLSKLERKSKKEKEE